jgi:hypothetical protein
MLSTKKAHLAFAAVLMIFALADSNVLAQRRGEDQQEAGKNGWLYSLDEAKAEARKTGLPLMVVFRCVP